MTSAKPKRPKPSQSVPEAGDLAAQLAAVSEVMQVIGRSRDDDSPVFQTILTNAVALCNAQMAGLILATDTDTIQSLGAHIGMIPTAVELFETGQMKMDPNLSYAARSIIEAQLIAFEDMGESELYIAGSPVVRSMVDDSGIRSVLFVPLMGEHGAIGAITLFRDHVAPFRAVEIALVESFAAQAVIAIENVRLFKETQTSLARQTASADILRVISSAQADARPVFEAISQTGIRLLACEGAAVMIRNGDRFVPEGGFVKTGRMTDLSPEPVPIDPALNYPSRVFLSGKMVHIPDMSDAELPVHERVSVPKFGMKSAIFLPMIRDGYTLGVLFLPASPKRGPLPMKRLSWPRVFVIRP